MCNTTIGNGPTLSDVDEKFGMTIPSNKAANTDPMQALDPTETTVAVCCGCRPKAKRKTRKYRKEPSIEGLKRVFRSRLGRYKDVNPGNDSEWTAFHHHHHGSASVGNNDGDDDSMFFFDAVDYPLEENEYPIDGYAIGGKENARVVFTTSIERPAPNVSLDEPTTMLRHSHLKAASSSAGSVGASSFDNRNDGDDSSYELVPEDHHIENNKARISNHKEPSLRFRRIRKRSTEELTAELQTPVNTIEDAIGLAQYPGTLKMEELEECQKFLKGLNELPPAVSEQVYSFRDVEDQPYTICRWLRATKFDAEAILARLSENQPLFEEAKKDNFYGPNIDEYLGCPLSVFLSQYPFVSVGRGKNGSPVNYFLAGKINPEGIMALCTSEQLMSYFWWSFMYKFKDEIQASRKLDPDFCRCEGINVVDLSGLSASALSSETMDVIKQSSKVSDFFPETLHGMLVLNAPGFFTFFWKIMRKLVDARTASRIQLFSSQDKGMSALEKLVDKKELPIEYGGTNGSLREAFLKLCKDPKLVRQEIELFHCKRRSKKPLAKPWVLGANECMEVTIYTRSVSELEVTISLNGAAVKTTRVKCRFEGDEENPCPSRTLAVSCQSGLLVGPGEVMVEANDSDPTILRQHSSMSRGYCLVVGDVKPVLAADTNGTNHTNGERHTECTDETSVTNGDHMAATVTMTGLSVTEPVKSPQKRFRRVRRANE